MRFIEYTDKDFSRRKTYVDELDLLSVESGKLKGEKYFQIRFAPYSQKKVANFPENFLQDEFLALDPEDEYALLDFQRRYGRIKAPLFFDADSYWNNVLVYSNGEDLPNKHRFRGETNAKTAAINDYLEKKTGQYPNVVSLDEVRETVSELQEYIRVTTAVKKKTDTPLPWVVERVKDFVILANNVKCTWCPSYGAFTDDEIVDFDTVYVPLIPNIIFQQMHALASDKAYYECEVCGKMKQYARRQPKPGERHYCSESCRLLDKSRRQNKRRKDAKKGGNRGEE